MTDLKEYQEFTRTTDIHPEHMAKRNDPQLYLLMSYLVALQAEVGEVSEYAQKAYRDNKPIDTKELSKELGDILWNLSRIADTSGLNLVDIAAENVAKLKSRKERGVISGSGDNR